MDSGKSFNNLSFPKGDSRANPTGVQQSPAWPGDCPATLAVTRILVTFRQTLNLFEVEIVQL